MPRWSRDEALVATMPLSWHRRLACMPRASREQELPPRFLACMAKPLAIPTGGIADVAGEEAGEGAEARIAPAGAPCSTCDGELILFLRREWS
jgi:hypothetical protein